MDLNEALTFWTEILAKEEDETSVLVLDAETIPGWVIALRPGGFPAVEIWWEEDFIEETRIHLASHSQMERSSASCYDA